MNTFKFSAFLCSVLALSGCRDYEPENLGMSVFMHAYGDYFVAQVGQIAPEQSWDFSTAGGHRGQANRTRAVKLNSDGWYYPEKNTLDWMKTELEEQHDNSGLCKDFYLSWTPGMSFQIVPIWEGYAEMKWDLYMKVTPAEGGDALYDQRIWKKGENVQLKTQPAPTSSKNNWQYEEDEICVWFEMYYSDGGQVSIWPYTEGGNGGEFYTGADFGATQMQYLGQRNNKSVYKWTCSKKTSEISSPTKVIFKVNDNEWGAIDFRNHGYYHENNGTKSDDDGGNPGSPVQLYTPAPTPDPIWSDFGDRDNAANALDFRAKPITITDPNAGTSSAWPLGSIVSFYLKITGNAISTCANQGDMMSTLNKQIAFLDVIESAMPTNVDTGEGVVTGIMGCEDSHINWSGSDKDYNDVVFLINGVMPKPVVITNDVSVSTLKKRYMAEDLTNTGDMDFNDIVVDVENVRYTYWNVNQSTNERTINTGVNGSRTVTVNGKSLTLNFTDGICDVQTATVKHLCGTIPIRFKVGDTLLPWITDPTNLDQSKEQLNGTFSGTPTYGTGSGKITGIDPDVTIDVTGWDPKTNNVVVYAGWDASKGEATTPATDRDNGINSDGSDWWSTFPERGTIPCIIATDVTDPWTAECVDITSTNWWKTNFISTKTK